MKHLSIEINNLVAKKMETGEKEFVSSALSKDALSIVKDLMIYNKEDVILFCASLNLLNTYVKQINSDIGYGFKHYINRLFVALLRNNIPNVKLGMDIAISKKGNEIAYVIVQIDELQFSFHEIKVTKDAHLLKENTNFVHNLEFDGLRKQMCAVSVYEMAKKI